MELMHLLLRLRHYETILGFIMTVQFFMLLSIKNNGEIFMHELKRLISPRIVELDSYARPVKSMPGFLEIGQIQIQISPENQPEYFPVYLKIESGEMFCDISSDDPLITDSIQIEDRVFKIIITEEGSVLHMFFDSLTVDSFAGVLAAAEMSKKIAEVSFSVNSPLLSILENTMEWDMVDHHTGELNVESKPKYDKIREDLQSLISKIDAIQYCQCEEKNG